MKNYTLYQVLLNVISAVKIFHRRVEHHGKKYMYITYVQNERKIKTYVKIKFTARQNIFGYLIEFYNLYFSLIINKDIDYKITFMMIIKIWRKKY